MLLRAHMHMHVHMRHTTGPGLFVVRTGAPQTPAWRRTACRQDGGESRSWELVASPCMARGHVWEMLGATRAGAWCEPLQK